MLPKRYKEDAIILRSEGGSRNQYGEYVRFSVEEENVRLISAPANMGVLRDVLPEGSRLSNARRFFLETSVRPIAESDTIRYRNVDYVVHHVMDYSEEGFVEAVAIRPDL